MDKNGEECNLKANARRGTKSVKRCDAVGKVLALKARDVTLSVLCQRPSHERWPNAHQEDQALNSGCAVPISTGGCGAPSPAKRAAILRDAETGSGFFA